MKVGYLGSIHAVIYATLGTKCTFPMYRPILPYTILPSHLYPKSISSYPPLTFNTPRFPSIYILFHSTLSYSSVPYPKLLHPSPTEIRPKWLKAETTLVLLGQIDLPSGDKADTTRRKCLMGEDLPTFRHQVVLVTRDFSPRPGVPVYLAPWTACPPGGKLSRDILPPALVILTPGGQAVQAGLSCPPPI